MLHRPPLIKLTTRRRSCLCFRRRLTSPVQPRVSPGLLSFSSLAASCALLQADTHTHIRRHIHAAAFMLHPNTYSLCLIKGVTGIWRVISEQSAFFFFHSRSVKCQTTAAQRPQLLLHHLGHLGPSPVVTTPLFKSASMVTPPFLSSPHRPGSSLGWAKGVMWKERVDFFVILHHDCNRNRKSHVDCFAPAVIIVLITLILNL